MTQTNQTNTALVDPFGRKINYLRLSVTDRCDFRCVYCMDEEMTFVPRSEVLSLEEMHLLARAFVELGVQKIRLTGGEPLVRSGVVELCKNIASIDGLQELVMTTNGSQLARLAPELREAGLGRLNISLDSLDPDKFKKLTRTGDLQTVLDGIQAAKKTGFDNIKLNAVILKGRNVDEVIPLVDFAVKEGLHLSFIEEMPLGAISEHSRKEEFVSSDELKQIIASHYPLSEQVDNSATDGPSRYVQVLGSSSKIGFISPHSNNFCSACNRVRVTAEGRLLLCLGNEHSADLKQVIRQTNGDIDALKTAIIKALDLKPERHHFDLNYDPQILRFMNATGG
ncbi:cyclic pyranopterin phosphate synthase [Oleiphilus sp. HI0009]|uniref:GTP 3',8-cyclase MoaA n=3 Tax=Oleiphilus TaxID=141450 RepID=UPI0007C302D2|nr:MULTISPECIES: GTP 3',8-cyclase MoaA [unclassified Oleiphilus]KZX81388.1 cyclic pyranopterin phosphate synthase [Oleiphilus sp. HI0009]MCH2159633.1 GTP 3',8-cyclase MoaA [Oleiphilaceae bacterium]KZY65784.1 cyclic pyranopterin phosphate synthase [Oleiphilus sp. HI0066]KZY75558.1 cyclic pyranopterin phosphate synthase [Oleiphilus sp. HI0067]KZZ61088.1 cyclic pyranopterin phosphate synthase [Oleiphilus sp. HI0125]